MTINKLPPSHEIDTRYMGHVFQIMEDCADERAEGWTKLGLLVNQSPDNPSVLTYIAVVWKGKKYDKWFPELALKALADIFYDWQQELIVGDFPKWTAMFFGAVLQSDGNVRTLWLPEYAADYGVWRITRDAPNWPRVEAELDKLLAREQG